MTTFITILAMVLVAILLGVMSKKSFGDFNKTPRHGENPKSPSQIVHITKESIKDIKKSEKRYMTLEQIWEMYADEKFLKIYGDGFNVVEEYGLVGMLKGKFIFIKK